MEPRNLKFYHFPPVRLDHILNYTNYNVIVLYVVYFSTIYIYIIIFANNLSKGLISIQTKLTCFTCFGKEKKLVHSPGSGLMRFSKPLHPNLLHNSAGLGPASSDPAQSSFSCLYDISLSPQTILFHIQIFNLFISPPITLGFDQEIHLVHKPRHFFSCNSILARSF